MPINRRSLMKLAAGAATTGLIGQPLSAVAKNPPAIKAIAFDALPIFDPRPVFAVVNAFYPQQGGRLGQLWRSRQFEYQWLRALAGQYVDFWQATEEGLDFAAKQLDLRMSDAKRKHLMNTYLNLKPWSDVPDALAALKRSGIRMALLSNMTPHMLNTNVDKNNLNQYFEHVISTDVVKTYKPDRAAYQLGVDSFKLAREEIAFAAFSGWDVTGAQWFGYQTFWVNREGFKPETMGENADGTGQNLLELVDFATAGDNVNNKKGWLT